MPQIHDIRIGVYAVIVQDGKVLLPHWNERGHGGWTLPGGGLEGAESPQECVIREVYEESGYRIEVGDLLGVDNIVIPPEKRSTPSARPLYGLRIVTARRSPEES